MPERQPLHRRMQFEHLILVLLATGATAAAFATGRPYQWWNIAALLIAWLAVLAVTWRLQPVVVLGLIAVAGVIVAQVGSEMEVGLFLISVLALVVANGGPITRHTGTVLVACLLAPTVVGLINPEVTVPVWTMGVVFPALMGWSVQNQRRLADELAAARLTLAERAVIEERRQIARDVHDLVGHGLAASMVQVASARHVLRRDPDAADEALEIAERVGRASMQELRQTVSALRDDATPTSALPGGADIEALAANARHTGQSVTLITDGPVDEVDGVRGLTLYRICQEALANAAKHAPGSEVTVRVEAADRRVSMVVENGPGSHAPEDDPGRSRFGIRGMRERAAVVGGEVTAEPVDQGWRVELTLPASEEIV